MTDEQKLWDKVLNSASTKDAYDSMNEGEKLQFSRMLIQADIDLAMEAVEDIDAICPKCNVTKVLESYPPEDRRGIMIGLSIAAGFTEEIDGDNDARRWLKHMAKIVLDEKLLDAETLEEKV